MDSEQKIEERKLKVSSQVADAIGVAHFLVANFLVLFGELSNVFSQLGGPMPGLKAVYFYLDFPVYYLARPLLELSGADLLYPFFAGQMIIIASSLAYGFLSYLLISAALYYFVD